MERAEWPGIGCDIGGSLSGMSSGGYRRAVERGLPWFAAKGERPALSRRCGGGGPVDGVGGDVGEVGVWRLYRGAGAGQGGRRGGHPAGAAGFVASRVALWPRTPSGARSTLPLRSHLHFLTAAGPYSVLEG